MNQLVVPFVLSLPTIAHSAGCGFPIITLSHVFCYSLWHCSTLCCAEAVQSGLSFLQDLLLYVYMWFSVSVEEVRPRVPLSLAWTPALLKLFCNSLTMVSFTP